MRDFHDAAPQNASETASPAHHPSDTGSDATRPTPQPGIGLPAGQHRARRHYWAYSVLELAAVALLITQLATGAGGTWSLVAALVAGLFAAEGIRTHFDTAYPDDTEDPS